MRFHRGRYCRTWKRKGDTASELFNCLSLKLKCLNVCASRWVSTTQWPFPVTPRCLSCSLHLLLFLEPAGRLFGQHLNHLHASFHSRITLRSEVSDMETLQYWVSCMSSYFIGNTVLILYNILKLLPASLKTSGRECKGLPLFVVIIWRWNLCGHCLHTIWFIFGKTCQAFSFTRYNYLSNKVNSSC